ncbi:unnamed protein product [Scytosiphon promiscuus]
MKAVAYFPSSPTGRPKQILIYIVTRGVLKFFVCTRTGWYTGGPIGVWNGRHDSISLRFTTDGRVTVRSTIHAVPVDAKKFLSFLAEFHYMETGGGGVPSWTA